MGTAWSRLESLSVEAIQVELSQVRSRVRSMILLDGYTMADVTVIRHVRSETLFQTNSSTVYVRDDFKVFRPFSFESGDYMEVYELKSTWIL